jgi:hypothetical protein
MLHLAQYIRALARSITAEVMEFDEIPPKTKDDISAFFRNKLRINVNKIQKTESFIMGNRQVFHFTLHRSVIFDQKVIKNFVNDPHFVNQSIYWTAQGLCISVAVPKMREEEQQRRVGPRGPGALYA